MSSKNDRITDGPLTIERSDETDHICMRFIGKSILRDPSEFLQPILLQVLEEAEAMSHRLVLDFRSLTYMNSSTFTPLVKTLERAQLGRATVQVIYNVAAKWQAVSFNALSIFSTSDGRISVIGEE